MLNKIRLGPKLVGGFALVAVIAAIIGIVGYLSTKSTNDGLNRMHGNVLVPIEHLKNADGAFYLSRGELYRFFYMVKERATIEPGITSAWQTVDKEMQLFRSTDLSSEEKEALARFDAAWSEYKTEVTKVIADVKAGNEEQALVSLSAGGAAITARQKMGQALTDLEAIETSRAEQVKASGEATFASATTAILVASVISMLLAVAAGVALSKNISGPMAQGVQMMKEL